MEPADRSKPRELDVCPEAPLVPSETYRVDDDAYREIEAALCKPAARRPAVAELFSRPRPE